MGNYMKYYFIIETILISLLLLSCDSNSPTDPYDEQLKKDIIGIWTNHDDYTVEFYNNGQFRDSIVIITLENQDTTTAVRKGKYYIKNSILKLTDFTFDYVHMVNLSGIGFKAIEFKILMNDRIMQREALESFDNVFKSKKNIWGDWFKNYYICEYSTDTTSVNGPIYGVEHYLFVQDSAKFRKIIEYEYPLSNVDTVWVDYTYNEPNLSIPAFGYYDVNVKFEDEKMIWYFNSELNDLIKIH